MQNYRRHQRLISDERIYPRCNGQHAHALFLGLNDANILNADGNTLCVPRLGSLPNNALPARTDNSPGHSAIGARDIYRQAD
jgi:hypothetical protein